MNGTWKAIGALWLLLSAASFAVSDGTVSGRVQDATGKPQMGATVEVYSSSTLPVTKAYTDAKGVYTLRGLLPGTYFLKATATQFLPTVREGVTVKAGSHLLVNLTLTTLIEAFQLLPTRKANQATDDDWRWTLRSSANRPILRVLEDSGLVVVSRGERGNSDALKGQLAFLAGSDGAGISGSDVTTNFKLEHSMFSSGTVAFSGKLGSMDGQANGALRASYKHRLSNGNQPEFSVALRRFASPDLLTHHAGIGALSLGLADHTTLADFLEAEYGGELQTTQFRGRTTAFRPFVVLTAHTADNMTVQYRYATTRPNPRAELGFENWASEVTLADPRVSLQNGVSKIERARHHEIAIARRLGDNNFQVAVYSDSVRDPSLLGAGDVSFPDDFSGSFLPDVYSNTFNYTGRSFSTSGTRAVAQHKFDHGITATVDYSYGGALLASPNGSVINFEQRRLHAATAKLTGNVPATGTRWLASYKWTSDPRAVTPVDVFNDSAGRSDPFLNIFIRQRIPTGAFLPAKMEALVDVRNLLAQGYVPFQSPDGKTIYLLQAARSLRGGVSFNF